MKKFIHIISFLVLTASMTNAQSTLKAKMEFEEAEIAYAANKYQVAIEKLNKAEELLGKWAPNISFLKIQALDKVCDYENAKTPYRTPLAKEVKSYLAFANENETAIVFDKFKEVVQIEKRLNYAAEVDSLKKMEEYVLAKDALRKNEYAVAMDYYSKAAAKNNSVAMFEKGLRYYFGSSQITQNYPEAMVWFKKAAELNHLDALDYIGDMYSAGHGVTEDCAEAIVWYQKAIDYGSTNALNGMGFVYKYGGNGVAENTLEALAWYKKGADKGYAASMYDIGDMYEKGKGVPQNQAEAFSWYVKAAEKEYYHAMKKVSECYEKGLGVTKDLDLAIKWVEKAIEVNKR